VYWNRLANIATSLFVNGTNVVAVRQYHRGGSSNRMRFDLQLTANTIGNVTTPQTKAIVIMSDGEATEECNQQDTGDPKQDAILASCDAYDNFGIRVYTVGYGIGADEVTMTAMANCSDGEYFEASNEEALNTAFSTIADTIIASSSTQSAIVIGNVSHMTLFGDSSIVANITPDVLAPQQNELSVSTISPALGACDATVAIYPGTRVVDARVTSYSGDLWTSSVRVDGITVYNLTRFASVYASVGDPFQIRLPASLFTEGNHSISLRTGVDALNESVNCSLNNTFIATIAVNLSTERSSVVEKSEGCHWSIAFADGTLTNLTIPVDYNGTNSCTYRPGNVTFDSNDAYQFAAYTIFSRLDVTKSETLFVDLLSEDLEVIVTTISKVPFLWGPAVMKLEVWR
jgi:hypothetical protein